MSLVVLDSVLKIPPPLPPVLPLTLVPTRISVPALLAMPPPAPGVEFPWTTQSVSVRVPLGIEPPRVAVDPMRMPPPLAFTKEIETVAPF
jgi:hypothetical protein